MRAFFFALAALVLWIGGARAAETITRFDSVVRIATDGTLLVTETITVNAEGDNIKRGIYRDFPTVRGGTWLGKFKTSFDVVEVTRDGRPENWFTEGIADGVRVYIGKADVMLTHGLHTYALTYRTDRQIGFFLHNDELYWNVTGNFWAFLIAHTTATIVLPTGALATETSSYSGFVGEHGGAVPTAITPEGATFTLDKTLGPGQGLSVVVAWDKGFVRPPTLIQRIVYAARDNAALAIILGGFLAVLAFYLLAWWHYGRDPEAGTIVAEYDPPRGLAPAACRYILRMGWDGKVFTSAVMNMAARGFLKIVHLSKHLYTLNTTGTSEGKAGLSRGESKVAQELFGTARNSITLKPEQYKAVQAAHRGLRRALEQEHDYVHLIHNKVLVATGLTVSALALVGAAVLNPDMFGFVILGLVVGAVMTFVYFLVKRGLAFVRKAAAFAIAVVMFFSSALVVFAIHSIIGLNTVEAAQQDYASTGGSIPLTLATVAIVIVNIIFFDIMKAPTAAGRKLMDRIEGFRHYLMVAEKDRLNFHNPPELTPERFEAYLPYAVALGVENEWGEQFDDAMSRVAKDRGESWRRGGYTPGWYSDYDGGHGISSWGDMTSDFSQSVASASASPSQSSGSGGGGGGFSGGGGGGGGGGGW